MESLILHHLKSSMECRQLLLHTVNPTPPFLAAYILTNDELSCLHQVFTIIAASRRNLCSHDQISLADNALQAAHVTQQCRDAVSVGPAAGHKSVLCILVSVGL